MKKSPLISILSFLLITTTALGSPFFIDCDTSSNALSWIGANRVSIESSASPPAYDGKRFFYTYVPECAGEDSPLVFDIHGTTECPQIMSFQSGWKQKADENCFVVVWPLGNIDPEVAEESGSCWSVPGGTQDETGNTTKPCCCYADGKKIQVNDRAFLRDVISTVIEQTAESSNGYTTIDTGRIYMAGHSNGCIIAMSMGATYSDLIAAVGCHSGTVLTPYPENYSPTPVMMVHGTSDQVIPSFGTDGTTVFDPQLGEIRFLSVLSGMSLIAKENGCTALDVVPDNDLKTNNVTYYLHTKCENYADVVLMQIEGAGHVPYPGLPSYSLGEKLEGTIVKVDTTQAVWDFLKKYSLREGSNLKSPKGVKKGKDSIKATAKAKKTKKA